MTRFFRDGHDRGRIYRVYPKGGRPAALPTLGDADTPSLVEALERPNRWQRDTARAACCSTAATPPRSSRSK